MSYCWYFKGRDPSGGALDTIEEVKREILAYTHPDEDGRTVCICHAQIITLEDGIPDDPETIVEWMGERASNGAMFDDPIFVADNSDEARKSLHDHLLAWAKEYVEMNYDDPYIASAPIETLTVGEIRAAVEKTEEVDP